MPKIKINRSLNTNKSDNTRVNSKIVDLRDPIQKKIDLQNYKKNQRFGKSVQNVISQTALDQLDYSYNSGMKNDFKTINIGTKINTGIDITDIKDYNNKFLGIINAGLNTFKIPLPILGDGIINSIQEGIRYYDEQNPTDLSKIKNLPEKIQKKIVNKPFGYVASFAKGGRTLKKYGMAGLTGSSTFKSAMNKPTILDLSKSTTGATIANTGAGLSAGLGLAGSVIPIATSFIPKNNYTDNQGNVLGSTNSLGADVLNNAATGASLGTMIAPGIGTAIGGALGAGYGALTNRMETNDMIDARNRANIRNNNRSLSNKMLNNNNMFTKQNYNNDNMVFANGGMVNINDDMPNASEEVEGNETAITPDGQHIAFNGPSHEEGGIETNLPEGTFIFSDRLKMGKKTFASLAKPIQNKITKLEENPSKFAKNSKELLTKQLDFLANTQEQIKQETDMKRSLKFAKGGMVKYDGGGTAVGSINPKTGNPFTPYEIALYHSMPQTNRFGTEYVGAGSVKDGVQERLYRNIPEANMGKTPLTTSKRSVNQVVSNNPNIKFQPQESFDNRLPIKNPQYIPSNTYQAEYENNLQNLRKGQFDYENTLYNGLPKNPSFNLPELVGPNKPTIPVLNQEKYINSTEPKTNSFNNVDYNELGQIGASVGSNFAQVNRINNMAKPRTLNNVRLQSSMTNPKYVNLSGQRNAISRVANNAMGEAGRNFGNSASIQAFKNKARLNELQGLGESYQNQENTNAGIFNQYANQRNEIAAKEALTNAEIDKYNIDAAYGDAASRVSGKNAATAQLGNTIGQVFGNRTAYKNQLDQANILKNSYNPEVINRAIENGELVYRNGKLEAKAYGGKIKKRSLKK